MGNIYNSENVLSGWASNACVAMVGSDGYVYTSPNVLTGWASNSCVGRVDNNSHYVYCDTNVFNGWGSSACLGEYDENGYIYRDKPTLRGYASSACIGHFANGYIYVDKNWATGFSSGACVGKADNVADAAAFLLLILPKLRANSSTNSDTTHSSQRQTHSKNEQAQSQREQDQSQQKQDLSKRKARPVSVSFPWWIWIILISIVLYAFAVGISILFFFMQCMLHTVPGWSFILSGIVLTFTLIKYSSYKGDKMKPFYPEALKKSVPITVLITICFIIQVLVGNINPSDKLDTLICGAIYIAADAYLIMLCYALKLSAGVYSSSTTKVQNSTPNNTIDDFWKSITGNASGTNTKNTANTNTSNAFNAFNRGNQPVSRSSRSPQPNNLTPQQALFGWIITAILIVMLIGIVISLGGLALGIF